MATPLILHDVRLIPVVELEPSRFATRERPLPAGSSRGEWDCYWRASLADSGLVGLPPLRPGSWHVPTTGFTDPALLGKFLEVTLQFWGPEVLSDPDGLPVLEGGLALYQGDAALAEPTCCVDLSNLADWREAAAYRGPGWQMLWIGHPWLSVRFDADRLILSEPHESDTPTARWAVTPDHLDRAIALAEEELERFAGRLRRGLEGLVGREAPTLARKLAGLA
jgi:hypothetical protein